MLNTIRESVPYAPIFIQKSKVYIDLREHKDDSKFLYNIAIIKFKDNISHE